MRGCEPTGVLSGLGVDWVVRGLGQGVFPAALEPVFLAVHLQDVDVVGEPFRAEYFRPLVERHVDGYQGGIPLVAPAEHLE